MGLENVRIGIIGYGYWGPNLVRNFNATDNCEVKYVADSRQERLNLVKMNYPSINTTTNAQNVIASDEVDAIVIATPVFTHYDLSKAALENKKHVLLEKPMTSKVSEAEELISLAQQNNLQLMVDHTFLYTSAVHKMKEIITDGHIGNINYVDSTRINLGLFQPDINVLWDLAPHDISIVNYLVDDKPSSVQAIGTSHTDNEIENIAYLTLNYSSGFIAHFNCSWSSPVKIRQMLIGADEKMILYNDMEPTEKVKVYDYGYTHKTDEDKKNILVDYRTGDIYVPKISQNEALAEVAKDFMSSIVSNTKPVSDYISGINVVKVLEAAQRSIKNNGSVEKITYS